MSNSAKATARDWQMLGLSAKSEGALTELVERFVERLAEAPDASLADFCYSANTGLAHFPWRIAAAGRTTEELRARLAKAEPANSNTPPRVAFLFTGQGAQYLGMGRKLFETHQEFRKNLERCDEVLRSSLERPLLSVLFGEGADGQLLDDTAYTQPALFALEYSLAQLWRSWGIEPSAVMGHSVGEYAAACVAGVYELEDGLKLIAERGRLMSQLPRDGAMAAVFAEEERVASAIQPDADTLSIAASNGPRNTVISGRRETMEKVLRELKSQGIKARQLTVSHAFHSPLMEPMLDSFQQAAAGISHQAPKIDLVSNLTGEIATSESNLFDADYWRQHIRQPVRFAQAMNSLAEAGYEHFLEIGPQPTLIGMARQCLPENYGVWLLSLRKGRDDWQQLTGSLSELYVQGANVDWKTFHGEGL